MNDLPLIIREIVEAQPLNNLQPQGEAMPVKSTETGKTTE
jgi:hypothetical protein